MKQLEKLKTFEDACKAEGLDPKKVMPDFSCYPEQDRKSMEAHAKVVIIVRAANRLANNGNIWTPDYSNYNQAKYEIWWDYVEQNNNKDGSSSFRFHDYGTWGTISLVGSRLCFISNEVAEYVANQFVEIFNEYLL